MLNSGDFLSGTCVDNASIDCNCNGVDDACDIALGEYADTNNDGIPDVCQRTCPCDWNHSGSVNSQDFFDFIACFFGSCPSGRTADYNSDGFVNSQDFFDFIFCFFNGCP